MTLNFYIGISDNPKNTISWLATEISFLEKDGIGGVPKILKGIVGAFPEFPHEEIAKHFSKVMEQPKLLDLLNSP